MRAAPRDEFSKGNEWKIYDYVTRHQALGTHRSDGQTWHWHRFFLPQMFRTHLWMFVDLWERMGLNDRCVALVA